MSQITKIRVVDVDHPKGTLSAIGKYNGKEQSMNFQFAGTYRHVQVHNVQGDRVNFSLSNVLFCAETYPQVGDDLLLVGDKGAVLGWCYYLEYEIALLKCERSKPLRVTSWMKILGITTSDKVTERLIKEKFRDLSKELHPDKPGGDAVKFQKLTTARDEALSSLTR